MKKLFWVSPLILLLLSCLSVSSQRLGVDYYNLGLEFHSLGQLEKAEYYYLQCLQQEDPPLQASYNLVVLYVEGEAFQDAHGILNDLEALDPGNQQVKRLRLFWQVSLGDRQHGRETAMELLELNDRDGYALESLARVAMGDSQFDEAWGYIERIPQEDQDRRYFSLVMTWLEKARQFEAQEEIRALQEEAENPQSQEDSPGDEIPLEEDLPPAVVEEEEALLSEFDRRERDLYHQFRQQEWMEKNQLERLADWNIQLEEFGAATEVLDILRERYPLDRGSYLFKSATILLIHEERWEQGFLELRRAFSSGFQDRGKLEQLKQELNPSLGEEVEYLANLYLWE